MIVLCCIIFVGCSAEALEIAEAEKDRLFTVSRISHTPESVVTTSTENIKGIWVSQFDMHPIYRNGSKQRDEKDYRNRIKTMIGNLADDGFDTVFLQLRPNGDSMYESDIYPNSKYIAGVYGGETEYDAIEIFLSIAKDSGISVHAWINPYRLCTEDELTDYGKGKLYEWYCEGLGKRIELGDDGLLYLDPSYGEATELIVDGAKEILDKYDFDGIHIDDYFYPTEFEFNDEAEFLLSGYGDKGDFRRSNIDRTVCALYNAAHEYGKVFGVSPAGNIYSLSEGWYVDIYKWCSDEGYIDYVMPQLYFGFENETCPFEKILADWTDAVTNERIELYIGLSAAKCALGSEGIEDSYAGGTGRYEWQNNKDILARSVSLINKNTTADGFCIFTYSSFYDPLTGEDNPLTREEKTAFCEIIG